MASIRERTNTKGVTTWTVMFRHGTKQAGRSYFTAKAAEEFKRLVESVGPDDAITMDEASRNGARTLDSIAVEWLDWKRSEMSIEGHRDYERSYTKWIKKQLGWKPAEMVNESDVQKWVDKTLKPKLAPKSVGKQHALLHGIYAWASKKSRGYVTRNPCLETELPTKKKRTMPKGLKLPEFYELMAAGARLARTDTSKHQGFQDAADVIAVMGGTGWRPGEALAPTVGAVEVTDNGKVYLSMERVFRRSEGIVEGGKTDAALRRIQVLGPGADVLKRRIVGKKFNQPLFPNPVTGEAWNPVAFNRNYWKPIVAEAGLADRGPTPYWLRHTHVAICVLAGLGLPEIQRRIGHESIQTTIDVYGSMIDGMSDIAATALEALLKGQVKQVIEAESSEQRDVGHAAVVVPQL